MSPFAAPARASACACATTLSAVISPLKTFRLLMSAVAVEPASVPDTADALASAEPDVTRWLKSKLPVKTTESFGGDEAMGVPAPSWLGTSTRIA